MREAVKHWISRVAVVTLPMLALFLDGPSAYATSCGTPSFWHVGYHTTSQSTSLSTLFGARATIDVQGLTYCSGGNSTNFSNAYVMMKSNPDFANDGWGQAGWERGSADGPHPGYRHFAQVVNGNSTNTWYSAGTLTLGTTGSYRAENFNTAPALNQIQALVNTNVVLVGSTTEWASPFSVELSEEARYREDDVSGVDTNRTNFAALKYKSKSSGSWIDMPEGIFDTYANSSKWHHVSVSGTQKQMWSDPTN